MNNYKVKEITDFKKFSSPMNTAFDVFERDKFGYCAIIFKPSISPNINDAEIIKVVQFDKYRHIELSLYILGFLKLQESFGHKLAIYEYIEVNDCVHDSERKMVKDVTEDKIETAKSFIEIYNQLG